MNKQKKETKKQIKNKETKKYAAKVKLTKEIKKKTEK